MVTNEDITEMKNKLEEHEKRISKLESIFQEKPEPAAKKVSIKEFILSKKPKDDVHKTLTIGYYLENYEGLSAFNVKDLERGFRAAKERVPRNTADKVQLNAKKGHMMETADKKDGLKAYVLTGSGQQYVENDFKKEK